jgi:hypothetical protein
LLAFSFEDRCDEPLLDHFEHTPVTDPTRNALHQLPMRNRAEVVAEIRIDNIGATLVEVITHLSGCLLRIPPLPEPELLVRQIRIKDGIDHSQHRPLRHSVPDCRNSEWTITTTSLRYPHSQERLWRIRSAPQLLLQVPKPFLQPVGFDLFERQSVNTRGTVLCAAPKIGVSKNVNPADLVPQAVESIAWFGLSFHV